MKDPAKPYAISPNSHVFFFGQLGWICNYDFESGEVELVHAERSSRIASPSHHFPFFTLRPCLIPFHCLDERNVGSSLNRPEGISDSEGAKILSAELSCQCDEQKYSKICRFVRNNDSIRYVVSNKRPFVFPSEMQLCAAMEMHQ